VRDGKIVVVNTARGLVGEDTAAMIGATILNLVGMAIAAQADLPPGRRRDVVLLVDEFHTIPAADYERILSELSKYGASLILATQSLSRLEALDSKYHRALRGSIFANIDGLFAFHTSAEDARYLVDELAGRDHKRREVDEADLLSLPDYHCYARLWCRGEHPPVLSVALDPPPPTDARLAAELAAASAERYGRDIGLVDRDLEDAQKRVRLTHPPGFELARPASTVGQPAPGREEQPAKPDRPRKQRGRKHPKRDADAPTQTSYLEPPDGTPAADGSGEPPLADGPAASDGAEPTP
jgi:hypothetical protein